MSRRRVLLAAPLVVLACSAGSPAPPQVIAPAPVPVATPAAPVAAGPSVEAAPPPPVAPRFFPALSSSHDLQLWSAGKALVAVTYVDAHARFAVAEGDDFAARPEMAKGLPALKPQQLVHLVGRLPGPLWLVLRTTDYPTAEISLVDDVFRLHEDRWQSVEHAPRFQSYSAVWEAPEGCLVGMRGDGMLAGGTGAAEAHVRAVDCKGLVPALPAPKRSGLVRAYNFRAAHGLPSGDLYALATAGWGFAPGPPENLPPVLEIWPHDHARTSTSLLPLPTEATAGGHAAGGLGVSLLVRSPTEVYAAANLVTDAKDSQGRRLVDREHWLPPFLARFDGAAWTRIDLPPVSAYTDLQLAGDGSLLLVGLSRDRLEGNPDALWGLRPGGKWEDLGPLPGAHPSSPRYVPRAIRGRSLDDLWVMAETPDGRESVVFHSRPAPRVIKLDE